MSARNVLILALAAALLAGCSSTKPAVVPTTDQSGFFRDYAALRNGQAGEPMYIYKLEGGQLSNYDKVLLEPIQVRRGDESRSQYAGSEGVQFLADYFYTLISARLARDYELVGEPGPRVMRIRAAISKIGEENMRLDVSSSTQPQPDLIPKFKEIAKQPPRFVGEAGMEMEVLDSETGIVFWAGVERKPVAAGSYGWEDLEADLKFNAERLGYRLCVERGDKNCVRPVRGH